jgi:hypothetical protein
MNKTLIAVGVGIWGVMLILNFILSSSLGSLGLTCEQRIATLFPLTLIEIIAFVITMVGIFRRE